MNSYNKTFWSDDESPHLNAENLNKIENGIDAATKAITATEGEISTARGKYNSLGERLDRTGTPTDEQVAEAVSDYFDEHPISGAEKYVEVADTSDKAVDSCTSPDTVYIVRVVSGIVTNAKMRVVCTPNVAGQMAQYAMTKDGYIISRKFTASEWGAWDFIPDSKRVAAMISDAIAGKADSSAIPTKTSQLNNDSGFLTQHQDISGKADKSTTLAGYGITDAYTKTQTDRTFVDWSTYNTELDGIDRQLSSKAEQSTTLAGYGITNAYTKSEIDAMIGNIETLLSQI
ncbi:MAG TPA: hypothetical protein DCG28_01315 [Lachnospiraceae bacterium]|nr:hypothetical protein [Lachnospiraceae bacterium]